MIDAFKRYIQEHQLIPEGKRILVGISGGPDSVVLAHLCLQSGIRFALAHCNFQLRDEDSNKDEHFVEKLAEEWNVPLFKVRFNTNEYAEQNKISTQMAARDLRMNWFDQVLEKENYYAVATAHHLDDQIETFFINLLRGAGISGMHGILPRNKKLIHPLLFCYRKDIETYIQDNNLSFRTDITNLSTKYLRNKIRHDLIPVLQELNDKAIENINRNILQLRTSESLLNHLINSKKKRCWTERNNRIFISIKLLNSYENKIQLLFEWIRPYGFNYKQCESIIESLKSHSGKQFLSTEYRIIRDRKFLILQSLNPDIIKEYSFDSSVPGLKHPIKLSIKKYPKTDDFELLKSPNVAYFDADRIGDKLSLRKWQEGDYFYPFGLNKKKKISALFKDHKLSLDQKETQWLLTSNAKIIWVIGIRTDHRFRITEKTKNILEITYTDH